LRDDFDGLALLANLQMRIHSHSRSGRQRQSWHFEYAKPGCLHPNNVAADGQQREHILARRIRLRLSRFPGSFVLDRDLGARDRGAALIGYGAHYVRRNLLRVYRRYAEAAQGR
jgi:hypothetical protein